MAATYSTLVANRLGGWRTVLHSIKDTHRPDPDAARSFPTPHEAVNHAHSTYGTLVLIPSDRDPQHLDPPPPEPPAAA